MKNTDIWNFLIVFATITGVGYLLKPEDYLWRGLVIVVGLVATRLLGWTEGRLER